MSRLRLEHQGPGTSMAMAGGPDPSLRPPTDLPRKVQSFFRIIVLCGLVGAGLGTLWSYAQRPVFRTAAHVQIVDRVSAGGLDSAGTKIRTPNAVQDEVFVIRSERMLRRAAQLGHLDEADMFLGQTPDAIASALSRSESLAIGPARSDDRTNVIQVQFDAPDPITPQLVVQAIVDAYVQHTTIKEEETDDQALQQILTARDEAADQLRELEREHDEFKQQTELIFVDGQPKSVHRKTADRYLVQREDLLVRQAEIQSRLSAAEDSLERGESPATVLIALRGETETASDVIDQAISNQLERIREETQDRASIRVRETQLLPLEMERNEVLRDLGASHPRVRSIDQKIAVVELQIKRMEEKEGEQDRLIAKAMSIRENTSGEIDPEAEIRQRLEVALNALRQQLDSVQQQLRAIDEAYEEESEAAKLEIAAERESRRFERDIARQTELYQRIVARLDDIQLATDDEGVEAVPLDDAPVGAPIERPLLRSATMGGLIGIAVALLTVLLLPSRAGNNGPSSDLVTQQQPVNIPLGPTPLLSTVDSSKSSKKLGSPKIAHTDPHLSTLKSAGQEYGFNAIRTALMFSDAIRGNQIVQITSASNTDGKSTVSANLAVAMACLGKKVLLLDADWGNSNIQHLFRLPDSRGLAWLLESISDSESKDRVGQLIDEIVQTVPASNLSVMTAGQSQTDPNELLTSVRIPAVFDSLRDRFDLIIIDSPPMSASNDPYPLTALTDAVLLAMQSSETDDVSQTALASEMLTAIDANLIGIVIPCTDEQGATAYQIYPVEALRPPFSFQA